MANNYQKQMVSDINTCSNSSCKNCSISGKTNCEFTFSQLFLFYLISLPSFIVGGIFLYNYHVNRLYIWLLIIGLFFLIIEIRVLCSHCPHYEKSSLFLNCWANYGAPKLWKYRPGPMNSIEKSILLTGFIIVWGYPLLFMYLSNSWFVLLFYISLVAFFFFMLRKNNCSKCINFSCPLNNVDFNTKTEFFRNNPGIAKHWNH